MKKLSKDVLTTGEVAKICNVSLRTVIKWFDKGILNGYIIPGTKDRRIPRSELIEFMKANHMPIALLEQVNKGELMEYCWEFFKRVEPDKNELACEDCLVYHSRTLQCYALASRLKKRAAACAVDCDECEYYHNIWKGIGKYSESLSDKEPCWEYYRKKDGDLEQCNECTVYKTRALKCFEYSRLVLPINYCKVSNCESCSYFRQISSIIDQDSSSE